MRPPGDGSSGWRGRERPREAVPTGTDDDRRPGMTTRSPARRSPTGQCGTTAGSDAGERTVDPRTTGARREVTESHRTGERLGLRVPSRPTVTDRRVEGLLGSGLARRGNIRPAGGLDRWEHAGVRGTVTARVGRRPVSTCGGALDGSRGDRRGDRRRNAGRTRLRSPTPTTGAGRAPGASRSGDVVPRQRKTGGLRQVASPFGTGGHSTGLPPGGQRQGGRLGSCGGPGFRQAQAREVGPRGLLDTAELHPHPHLAGAVRVVPPAEQLTGPPGTALVDLDGLGLAGEHGCSVLHGARHTRTVCGRTTTVRERDRTEG